MITKIHPPKIVSEEAFMADLKLLLGKYDFSMVSRGENSRIQIVSNTKDAGETERGIYFSFNYLDEDTMYSEQK